MIDNVCSKNLANFQAFEQQTPGSQTAQSSSLAQIGAGPCYHLVDKTSVMVIIQAKFQQANFQQVSVPAQFQQAKFQAKFQQVKFHASIQAKFRALERLPPGSQTAHSSTDDNLYLYSLYTLSLTHTLYTPPLYSLCYTLSLYSLYL